MAEVAALDKHVCPACGAEAHWNAARQALVCPYCGTVAPATLAADGSTIQEHDLVAALRAIPADRRGFGNDRTAVQCQSCRAVSLFVPSRVAQRCEFCGSPAVVPYTQTRNAIYPESLLPFRQSEPQIREAVRRWVRSRWFAPGNLDRLALTDQVTGIYVPYWTFDARVSASWTAMAGHYYYETRRVNGKLRQVRRVRWTPASGHVATVFDDELVCATHGVKLSLLKGIEPFPTGELVPYDPGYVSGWVVEQYHLDLVGAAEAGRRAMDEKVRALCAADVPGDTHRDLQVSATYTGQTFKHVLLPVWVVAYDYGRRRFQVVANGVTGAVSGERPWSWIKMLLAVAAAAIAAVAVAWLSG
ncbi:MAG: zinc ribbon domain-containing protein [Acidobacteriota bacterium]